MLLRCRKVIQRLTGDPINVPKVNIDNLDLIVIQAAVRGPDGKTVRRVTSVNEIVEYDSARQHFFICHGVSLEAGGRYL